MAHPSEQEKKKVLEAALGHIRKQFGEGAIMSLGAHSAAREVAVISTGAIPLDMALGIGGVPRGRIVEIFGPESSGKSTLATHIVANAQKNGGIAAYIDVEHALDPSYAAKLGVSIDDLLICQPDSGEEALNIAQMLADSNAIDVIIIDSVAALVPKAELEGEIGDQFVGLQARLMSQALRKLTAVLSKSNTCAVFINQIREKIGIAYGNPETTTGGRALKFYSSVRMEIRKQGSPLTNSENEPIGHKVIVKVTKNKMAPPFKTATFDLRFNEGISPIGIALDLGVDLGVISKKGTWFSYKEHRLGQGREAAYQELKAQPKMLEEIEKVIIENYKKLSSKPSAVLKEVAVEEAEA